MISVDGQVTDRLEYVRKTQEMLGQLRERGTSSAATNAMQMADDLVSLYARLDGDKQIVKGLVMSDEDARLFAEYLDWLKANRPNPT